MHFLPIYYMEVFANKKDLIIFLAIQHNNIWWFFNIIYFVMMLWLYNICRITFFLLLLLYAANRGTKPRLMIVSRKRTRILSNEDEVARLARKLGYEVVVAEADVSTNLTRFAQTVNSCDVLMGIHGAGLTNMVFLPDNAILIQIVPLGGIEVFARLDFGNPASGMNIRYLEYDIDVKESSLFQRYPINDPVLNDPMSFHRKGWGQLRSTYLDNQNVTVDIRRFKPTLAKALKLLQRWLACLIYLRLF